MKEALSGSEFGVIVQQARSRKPMWRLSPAPCSICTRRIWLHPVHLTEPAGVPEPRLSWVLCKRCCQVLTDEMQRSPVLSPLRLRIAMGMVAAEYWPNAYPTRVQAYVSDRKWIVFMAIAFIVAMLFHLALIIVVGYLSN